MEYIAFDAHKPYTLTSVAQPDGRLVREQRLAHERGAFQQFLARCEPGSGTGLSEPTLTKWVRPAALSMLRPVTLTPAPLPPPACRPVVITPNGARVKSLDQATLVVLRALG